MEHSQVGGETRVSPPSSAGERRGTLRVVRLLHRIGGAGVGICVKENGILPGDNTTIDCENNS